VLLVKAFLSEPGSDTVLGLLEEADPHCTSRLSFVDCNASFARGRRDERVTSNEVSTLILDFARQGAISSSWSSMDPSENAPASSRIATGSGLQTRSILASALQLAESTPPSVRFACWDRRLWEAAGVVGFTRIPEVLV
jgi:hypothetical protein